MSFLNHIKIELIIFFILVTSIFIFRDLDISIHNFVTEYFQKQENDYLINFFINVTELGDSLWYFILSISFLVLFYIIKKIDLFKIKNLDKKITLCISIVVYLLTVGLITQILKHVIGRPRPNYISLDNDFDFNFLTFESSFHSFPSGHASTAFMVCFILCAVLPKLKYLFYFLASIIALSRVVVGAHFFFDIIAGGLLALLVFKLLNNYFEKNNARYLFKEIKFEKYNNLYYNITFFLFICLILTIGPSIDLYVAQLFFLESSIFYLQSLDILSVIFREILIPIIIFYLSILPAFTNYPIIKTLYLGYKFSWKEIVFLWLSQIFTLILFINLILKNFWGRARPNDILEFGGDKVFTPWFQFTNACQANCSFVSGDSSVGFSIVILYLITKKIEFLYASLVFGFAIGFIRIIAGGHFFSDVLFSGAIIIILNLIIFQIYKKYNE